MRTFLEVRIQAYLTAVGGAMSAPASPRRRVLSRIRTALRKLLRIEHSPFMTL
ncbi:hypothetical protein [Streptomyces sp. NPDC006527]|uniref:hypothetical protein n=1 Tax=Streptomyces sp. NPDC006527 TaxID=3364749 RepID=UPI0036C2BC37